MHSLSGKEIAARLLLVLVNLAGTAQGWAQDERESGIGAVQPVVIDPPADQQVVPAGSAADKTARINLHIARSEAARRRGDLKSQIAELRTAHGVAEQQNPHVVDLLASASHLLGETEVARQLREDILKLPLSNGWRLAHTLALAVYAADFGDQKSAIELSARAELLLKQIREAGHGISSHAHFHFARGIILSAGGRFAEAETALRVSSAKLGEYQAWRGAATSDQSRYFQNLIGARLGRVLISQGKVPAAEWVRRDVMERSARETGPTSVATARAGLDLADTLVRLGRFAEARRLATEGYQTLEQRGALPSSYTRLRALLLTGWVDTLQGDYAEAIQAFERRKRDTESDPNARRAGSVSGSVVWGYALIRQGRAAEALPMLEAHYEQARARSEKSYTTFERASMYAYALDRAGRTQEAQALFRFGIPGLIEWQRKARIWERADMLGERIANWVIEGYMESLASRAAGGDPSAVSEMFRVSDVARGSSVQRALALSASRASIEDPRLASLVRRQQDAGNQYVALGKVSEDLLSRPAERQPQGVIAKIRQDMERLDLVREELRREINAGFPQYSQLVEPQPLTIDQVRKLLRPGEVLVSTYSTQDRTYVWAVPQAGEAGFSQTAMGTGEMATAVKNLRRAFEPGASNAEPFPAYDVALAYSLYEKLLKPLERVWRGAQILMVVPHAALAQIPFSALPTNAPSTTAGKTGFEGYRSVDWLLKQLAIVQLPSISALTSVRATRRTAAAPSPFIGFGDPTFKAGPTLPPSNADAGILRRNLRVDGAGDQGKPASEVDFRRLPQLPDTAIELTDIAQSLKADRSNVFLRNDASETNVKRKKLDDYRVVMFATHGLIPGDLDGLTQPALAMSNPAVTGEKEADGLLTMDEVLGLKLNADWVVLSACNTAAGDGAGSEAISGLGRAFFYAGARSLLVSNWPVETVSARLLTTMLFKAQGSVGNLSRAEALRRAMLGLLQEEVAKDQNGEMLFAYAHPVFWAPFSLVGDGGN